MAGVGTRRVSTSAHPKCCCLIGSTFQVCRPPAPWALHNPTESAIHSICAAPQHTMIKHSRRCRYCDVFFPLFSGGSTSPCQQQLLCFAAGCLMEVQAPCQTPCVQGGALQDGTYLCRCQIPNKRFVLTQITVLEFQCMKANTCQHQVSGASNMLTAFLHPPPPGPTGVV